MRVDARCKRGRAAVGFGAFGMRSIRRETGEGRKMSEMSRENGCEMSEWFWSLTLVLLSQSLLRLDQASSSINLETFDLHLYN